MPPVGNNGRGKFILNFASVAFLVIALFAVSITVSNPLKQQLTNVFAGAGNKVKTGAQQKIDDARSSFQKYVDSQIRQRERETQGGCKGAGCTLETLIQNPGKFGTQNGKITKPSAQQLAEQKLIDNYNYAKAGNQKALDTLKSENAALAKQVQAGLANSAVKTEQTKKLTSDCNADNGGHQYICDTTLGLQEYAQARQAEATQLIARITLNYNSYSDQQITQYLNTLQKDVGQKVITADQFKQISDVAAANKAARPSTETIKPAQQPGRTLSGPGVAQGTTIKPNTTIPKIETIIEHPGISNLTTGTTKTGSTSTDQPGRTLSGPGVAQGTTIKPNTTIPKIGPITGHPDITAPQTTIGTGHSQGGAAQATGTNPNESALTKAFNNFINVNQQISQNPNGNIITHLFDPKNIIVSAELATEVTSQGIRFFYPATGNIIDPLISNLPIVGYRRLATAGEQYLVGVENPSLRGQALLTSISTATGFSDIVNSSNRLFFQTGMTPEEAAAYRKQDLAGILSRAGDAFVVGSTAVGAGDFVASGAVQGVIQTLTRGTLGEQGFLTAIKNPMTIPEAANNLVPNLIKDSGQILKGNVLVNGTKINLPSFGSELLHNFSSAGNQAAGGSIITKINSAFNVARVPTNVSVFDPNVEVQNILKLPPTERAQALTDFKAKYAYQQQGIVNIQTQLEGMVADNPKVSYNNLSSEAQRLSSEYGLADWQKEDLFNTLRTYDARRAKINNIFGTYDTPESMFKAMFGTNPVGRVEFEQGAATIHLKIYNPEDYNVAYNLGQVVRVDATKSTGGFMMNSGTKIPGTGGIISVENKTDLLHSLADSQSIFVHEDQHALFNLFQSGDISPKTDQKALADAFYKFSQAVDSSSDTQLANGIDQYVGELKNNANVRTMNELLAYLKEGDINDTEIMDSLTRPSNTGGVYFGSQSDTGGLYDFYSKARSTLMSNTHTPNLDTYLTVERAGNSEFGPEAYKTEITNALDAFNTLTSKGFSRDEAISALEKVPLSNWSKYATRVGNPDLILRGQTILQNFPLSQVTSPNLVIRAQGLWAGVYSLVTSIASTTSQANLYTLTGNNSTGTTNQAETTQTGGSHVVAGGTSAGTGVTGTTSTTVTGRNQSLFNQITNTVTNPNENIIQKTANIFTFVGNSVSAAANPVITSNQSPIQKILSIPSIAINAINNTVPTVPNTPTASLNNKNTNTYTEYKVLSKESGFNITDQNGISHSLTNPSIYKVNVQQTFDTKGNVVNSLTISSAVNALPGANNPTIIAQQVTGNQETDTYYVTDANGKITGSWIVKYDLVPYGGGNIGFTKKVNSWNTWWANRANNVISIISALNPFSKPASPVVTLPQGTNITGFGKILTQGSSPGTTANSLEANNPAPEENKVAKATSVYEFATTFDQVKKIAANLGPRTASYGGSFSFDYGNALCGPLSVQILKDSGVLPPETDLNTLYDFDPTKEMYLLDKTFPTDSFTRISTFGSGQNLASYDWNNNPLKVGDWLSTEGGTFGHMFVISDVSQDGKVYAVMNYVDKTVTGNSSVPWNPIGKVLVWDQINPNNPDAMFNKWSNPKDRATYGNTGLNGFILERQNKPTEK